MSEQTSEIVSKDLSLSDNTWTVSPKDFIFKYLKYLPWVLVCGIIGLVLAYIKLRYIVPVYRVQSAMLIKNEGSNGVGKDQKFDELFMTQSSVNLANEMAILRSSPV